MPDFDISDEELYKGVSRPQNNSSTTFDISEEDLFEGVRTPQELAQSRHDYSRDDTSSFGTGLWNGVKGIAGNAVGFGEGLVNFTRGKDQDMTSRYLVEKGYSQADADRMAAEKYGYSDWSRWKPDITPNEAPTRMPVRNFFLDVAENTPQVAAQAGLTALTGGAYGAAAGTAFMGSQIAGADYNTLIAQGVDPRRAFQAGVADAMVQAPLEGLSMSKVFSPVKGSRWGKVLETTGTEALTEGVQQIPEEVAHLWAKTPDETWEMRGKKLIDDSGRIAEDAFYSGAVGGVFGLAGGVGNVVVNRKNQSDISDEELFDGVGESKVSYMLGEDQNDQFDISDEELLGGGNTGSVKGSPDINSFVRAISSQESGGDAGAVNAHTGAYGEFQILDPNWPSWAREAGISPDAPRTRENQNIIARNKMMQYYNEFGSWRNVAIAWYAGPGAVGWSQEALNRPQVEKDANGNVIGTYPSINEYADSIVNRMGGDTISDGSGSYQPANMDQHEQNEPGYHEQQTYDFTKDDLPDFGELKILTPAETVKTVIGDVYDGVNKTSNRIPYREVSESEAVKIKELTGIEVGGYKHVIDMDSIRHSVKKHGEGRETQADQIGMTREDYQHILEVINFPDSIEIGTTNPRTKNKTLRYIKNIGGQIYVAEEILTGSKTLFTKTMWKKPTVENHTNLAADLHHTSTPNGVFPVRTDNSTISSTDPNIDYKKDSGKSYMPSGIYDGMNYNESQTDGKTVKRSDIEVRIANFMGIPIRYGRLGQLGRKAKGWHDSGRGVIRIGERFDWDTITHEIGHHIDHRLGGVSSDPKHHAELSKWVSDLFGDSYAQEDLASEGVAEFFRQYLTNHEKAKENFPGFYKEMDARLKRNPKVLAELKAIKGDFDTWRNQASEDRVAGSISYGSKLKGLAKTPLDKLSQASDWFSDHFIDSFSPVFRMEKSFEKQKGVKIPDEQSPTMQIRTYRGVNGMAEANIMDGVKRRDGSKSASFQDVLQIVGKRRKEFSTFAVAKRELNMYAIERATGQIFDGHANTEEDAKRTVAKYANDNQFKAALLKLRDFQDGLMMGMVDEGLIKESDYRTMKAKWPDYVPMNRDMEDTDVTTDIGARFSSKSLVHGSSPLKKMKGSNRDVIDPLESILKNAVIYTTRTKANKVLRAVIGVAAHEGSAVYVEEVSGSGSASENIIPVFIKGEKKHYQVTPEVYAALKAMKNETPNAVIRGVGFLETMLRGSATIYNPTFVLTNFPRDFVAASINATHGFNAKVAMQGIESFLRKDKNYWDWMRAGGANSMLANVNRDEMQNMLNDLAGSDWSEKSPIETMKNAAAYLAEITEAGVRIGTYINEKKHKVSDIRAAVESRDVTVDFGRKGIYMGALNKVASFSNVFVQGLNIAYRVTKKHPKSTTASIAALTAFSIGLILLQEDDERFKDAMRRDKDRYWYILPSVLMGDVLTTEKLEAEMAKGKTKDEILKNYPGGMFRIPKPQVYGTIFVSASERLFQSMRGDTRAFDGWKESVIDELTPNLVPLLFKIPFEYANNVDTFRNKKIVPMSLEREHPIDQYDWKTTEVAKNVGNLLGASPMKIDHVLNSFGGLASDTLSGVDRILADKDKLPSQKPSEYYGVRRLMSEPFTQSQQVGDFYNDYYAQQMIDKHLQATGEELDGYDPDYFEQLKAAKKEIDGIAKAERAIRNDKTLTSDQKRAEIDKLQLKKLELARKVVK